MLDVASIPVFSIFSVIMEDNLVYKSNSLIEASYSLTINEQRLLVACISKIHSAKKIGDRTYTFTVDEAVDLFDQRRDNAYRDLALASERLFERKIISISNNGRTRELMRWVSYCKFEEDSEAVTLRFTEEIVPYISQLESNFTKYRLKHIAQLTSSYAVRIYELIVGWASQGDDMKQITLDELRDLLAIGLKYKQFGELRTRVIQPAVEQINESTNYNLEVSYRKRKRFYHWIQFHFTQKPEDRLVEDARKKTRELKNDAEKPAQKATKEFPPEIEKMVIASGMVFADKNGDKYTVDDGGIISHPGLFPNRPILTAREIKILLAEKKLKQVINYDTETMDML